MNHCLPLLPVCAQHLVLLNPAPQLPTLNADDAASSPCPCDRTPALSASDVQADDSYPNVNEFVNEEQSRKTQKNCTASKKISLNRTSRITSTETVSKRSHERGRFAAAYTIPVTTVCRGRIWSCLHGTGNCVVH
ncbi:hypothetical protein FGIG_10223 [Fasciola gigantica]|uniref:Uncharacterized protein n=1 Tax=Fasciola gigantica TaxID=46835 RepID=A0A504Z3W9_FASGI|nr:hypothetical protein FGIG_10223 [Fasciola gigantica]